MCLAAATMATGARRGRYLFIALAMLGVGLLLLTKSRTGLFSLMVAIGAFWILRATTRQRLLYGLFAILLVCSISLGGALLEVNVGGHMTDAMLLGREKEHLASLTGRIPLWNELLRLAWQRPMLGFGYGSFWTPERIAVASEAIGGSGVPFAHSAYLEVLLQAGLVGATLLLLVALVGIGRAAARYRDTGDPSAAFLFALMAYGLVHSGLESTFAMPSFASFLAGCGLSHMAFCAGHQIALAEHGGPLASPLAVITKQNHLLEGELGS
jgi:O-antigen ligase